MPTVPSSLSVGTITSENFTITGVAATDTIIWENTTDNIGLVYTNSTWMFTSIVDKQYKLTIKNNANNTENEYTFTAGASVAGPPTITSLGTGIDLVENSGEGKIVYTIIADTNGGGTITIYEIGGTDAGFLSVDIATGVVKLTANPDYEAQPAYNFTVTATNAAGTSQPKTVTFDIINIMDETPTDIALLPTPNTVNYGADIGTLVGNLTTTDADSNDVHTYTLSGTGDESWFDISGATLITAKTIDDGAKLSYSITITTRDASGNEFPENFRVDVNTPPTDITLSKTTVNDSDVSGTIVGTLTTTDVGPGGHTYTLSGTGASWFDISGATLIKTAKPINYITDPSFSIIITTTDASLNAFEKPFTINVFAITTQPTTSEAIIEASGTVLTVSVNISAGTTYQWYFDDEAISGETSSGLNISTFDTGDVGTYYVRATNDGTVIQSTTSTLSIIEQPLFTTIPQAAERDVGQPVTFSVVASGGGTMTYQWKKDDSNILDASGSSYTISQVTLADEGLYKVYVANEFGNNTTQAVQLTVTGIWDTKPRRNNANAKADNLFGDEHPGAVATFKNVNFAISNNKATLDTDTKTQIRNILKDAPDTEIGRRDQRNQRRASLQLLFTRNTTVEKMRIPKSDLFLPSTFKKTHAVVVKAAETFDYADLEPDEGFYSVLDTGESVSITLKTNTTLTFKNISTGTGENIVEQYDVSSSVPWSNVSIISTQVTGTFSDTNPSGTLLPEDIVIIDGLEFFIGSVGTGGTPPTDITLSNSTVNHGADIGTLVGTLTTTDADSNDVHTYDLSGTHKDWFDISGATLITAQTINYGTRPSFSIIITTRDASDNAFWENFTIYVNTPPTDITLSKTTVNDSADSGTIVGTLTTTDVGPGGHTYTLSGTGESWFDISGATLIKTAKPINYITDPSFSIIITTTDASLNAFEKPFTINVFAITAQPDASGEIVEDATGTVLTVSVNIVGVGTTYQWYFEDSPLNGRVSRTLYISTFDGGDAGEYYVRATNDGTVIQSTTSTLSIIERPTLSMDLAEKACIVDQSVTFSVTASGGGTMTYQWKKDDSNILDASGSSYTISQVTLADEGLYKVYVANEFGNNTTQAVQLTVTGIWDTKPRRNNANAKAAAAGVTAAEVATFKNVNFAISNNKATLDTDTKTQIRNILKDAPDTEIGRRDQRNQRRASLQLLFTRNTTVEKMRIPKSDLFLPSTFKKTHAVVVKAAETFDYADLEPDEGFYSVLDPPEEGVSGESVSIILPNRTLTFTNTSTGTGENDEQYNVSSSVLGEPSWSNVSIISTQVTGTFSDTDTSGTLLPEDIVIIDGLEFFIGSVGTGGTPPTDIDLSNNTINHGDLSGTLVGTLTTTDADSNDVHTYDLSGTHATSFSIDNTVTPRRLEMAETTNYNVRSSYSILITTIDSSSNTFTKSFTINVNPPSGSAGGDPYIFPIKSNTPVKLPNKEANYRLFEQNNTFINASVARATQEHMERMIEYTSKFTTNNLNNLIVEGFFFDKFYISVDGNKLVIDLKKKQISARNCKKDFFKFNKMIKNDNGRGYGQVTISWESVSIDVLFFANPQVENGINIRASGDLKNAVGLLVDNYKPKLMEIPTLQTTTYGKIHRRLAKRRNIHHKQTIFPKTEIWKTFKQKKK